MQEIELNDTVADAAVADTVSASSVYETVPYESFPFPRTHIRHLHAMARLLGHRPADPGRCRVLELGAAAGGNLLPMAIDHPESAFIGVDLAASQIEKGRRQIAELGLANIGLRAISLVDVEASFGSFDYVIAHGVYSWVPAEIRARLLQVCRERLAPGGILLLSYNTLPGWSVWQSLRDIILFHGRRFSDPRERARQARRLLSLRETGRTDKSPYWEMLRHEIEKTEDLSDWFFLHEHVEEENTPFYFHGVVEHARRASLDYLGEADLTAMNLAALPAPAIQDLGIGGDLVSRLQYLDVVQNRRFRMSLFCRQGEGPGRLPRAEDLWDFHWNTALRPQVAPAPHATAAPGAMSFVGPGGEIRLRTVDPMGSAVYDILCRQALPQRPEVLVRQAMERYALVDEPRLRAALLQPALDLVMSNLITLHSHPPHWLAEVSDRPQASRLARAQAREADWVTNQCHEAVGADPLLREMIRLADGRHSRVAMVEALRRQAERGRLGLQPEGRPALDRAESARMVPALVDQLLSFMAASALLVA